MEPQSRRSPYDTSKLFMRFYPVVTSGARLGMKLEQLGGGAAIALVAASLLWASTTPASANLVLPGGTVTPDLFGAISGSVLATTGTVPLTSVPPSFMSTYVEEVVADAGRGGLLDFILQTTNSPASGDALGRVTLTSLAGFATDVGTATSAGGLAGGTAPPVNITRGSAGNVVGFNFAPGVLSPGTTSEILVVETNAPAFIPGTVLETDGGAASGPGFAPVPAPSIDRGLSVLLAVGGLLFGSELFERSRKRRSLRTAAA